MTLMQQRGSDPAGSPGEAGAGSNLAAPAARGGAYRM